MPEYYQKTFKIICLSCLALCVVALGSGVGCSKGILRNRLDPGKKWTCDKDADEAMQRQDYAAGILFHHRFLKEEPANGLALYHLGYACGQTENHIKEVFYYEKAIAVGFRADYIFFNLGMAYGELNQSEKSIRAFKKALDINPGGANNHFGLAVAYQRSYADKPAEQEFLKVIKIDPGHVDARLYLSMLYADMGEQQKAVEQLQKILEIDPSHRMAREFLKSINKE